MTERFATWKTANTPHLTGIQIGNRPKALVETLSESLLETFRPAPLIDPYDVYQHLMDYWAETMQDDVYMIVSDGWKAVLEPSTSSVQAKPNFDLIPANLVVTRYFAKEQAAIEQLETDRDAISRQMEEMDEEQGGEDGLLAEAKTDKGKLTAKSIKEHIKAIKHGKDTDEERKVLEAYLDLIEQEAVASKKVKEAQKALDAKMAAKYGQLSEAEIKTLVVDDKWLTQIAAAVQSELDRVSQALTGRIKQLAERYAVPLPQLVDELETLAERVDGHFKKMGFGTSH
ncbi:MAG: hypothetical protein ACOYMG_16735 [Candidatus Methylumidiphilus sp.]